MSGIDSPSSNLLLLPFTTPGMHDRNAAWLSAVLFSLQRVQRGKTVSSKLAVQ